VSQGLRCGLPCRCRAGSTSDPAVPDHVAKSTSSHRGREQPTTRSRRRRGASALTQSPRSCSCHKPSEPRRETVPPTSPGGPVSGKCISGANLAMNPASSDSAVTDHTVSTRPRLGTATEASPSTRDNDPEPINVKAAQRQEFTPPQGSRHLTKPHSAVNKSCQTRRGEAAVRQLPRCPAQQVVGRPSTPVLAAALRRARCGRSETSEDDRSLECVLVGRCLTDVTSDGPRGTGWLNR